MNVWDLFSLKGKIAVVTGSSRGLGRQMAHGLAEAGADVVTCSRNKNNCELVSEELMGLGVKSISLRCDVSVEEEVKTLVTRVREEFGRIDILVNNAGTSWGIPPEDMTLDQWNKVFLTNSTGTFLCSREVGRVMIEQGGGKIINISSVAGLFGTHPDFMDAIGYQASKGSVATFTKDLAMKWAKYNIYVNSIAPGVFPTKMSRILVERGGELAKTLIPLKRLGSDYDLKGAVVYLASAASDYVTGHILFVDGGQSAG
ncbi:MAG TPA: SDR family oxidoreductase [Spirochaetia bacterium]|nr:SDR family oxidoreductase [Spirochaetia bacterium]